MADQDATTMADGTVVNSGKKKGSSFLVYIAIAVVMIVAGYFVGSMMSGKAPTETQEAAAGDSKSHSGDDGHGTGTGETETEIFMIEDVIVNPSGTGGTRFLSVSFGFELGSEETRAKFEEREPIIKDALITILGSKTISQLTDAKEKEITRFQIRKRVEYLLKVEDIAAVYYTDYILQ